MVEPSVTAASEMITTTLVDGNTAQALAGALTTWRTVDRREVHKASLAEVFVTDLSALGGHRFAAAAQWPRWHPYYRPEPDGPVHPLLFVESLRQAGIVVNHRHLGVPLGQHFVFSSIDARYASVAAAERRTEPSALVLVVQVHPLGRGSRLTGARLEIEAWAVDRRIATATAAYRCLSDGAYRRLRALHRTSTKPDDDSPADAGATTDVPTGRQTFLAVDDAHPTFFDHPVDHLPGMLLMDATLRAAGVTGAAQWPDVGGFELNFRRYAERDLPTVLTSRSISWADRELISVVIEQAPHAIADGTVWLRPTG